MGKWGSASQAEIDAELEKGTPFTYRFRVPQEGSVTIHDLIRGEVSWKKDTLGDFVVLRSNGQPVYNFCVAVDDATMKISHVIRAEEHLPNTLRQALIYNALGFSMPQFGHVSLILAPDRSKLSKRHGATSVGQFREMGYLAPAMVNYLALLGWNDGSEDEIFTIEQIIEKFSIDRITKSGAIFDQTKLGWMNGQHLRLMPTEDVATMFREQWLKAAIVSESVSGSFIDVAVELLKNGTELVADSENHLLSILHYPLNETLTSSEVKHVVDDNISEVADAIVSAYDNGELQAAIEGGHDAWSQWIKAMGKAFKRKGKRLFMPVRVLLTGSMKGPEVGAVLGLVREGETTGSVTEKAGLVPLDARIKILREVDWAAVTSKLAESASQETEPALSH
jgi:glutamyl-tRNA synthetase